MCVRGMVCELPYRCYQKYNRLDSKYDSKVQKQTKQKKIISFYEFHLYARKIPFKKKWLVLKNELYIFILYTCLEWKMVGRTHIAHSCLKANKSKVCFVSVFRYDDKICMGYN